MRGSNLSVVLRPNASTLHDRAETHKPIIPCRRTRTSTRDDNISSTSRQREEDAMVEDFLEPEVPQNSKDFYQNGNIREVPEGAPLAASQTVPRASTINLVGAAPESTIRLDHPEPHTLHPPLVEGSLGVGTPQGTYVYQHKDDSLLTECEHQLQMLRNQAIQIEQDRINAEIEASRQPEHKWYERTDRSFTTELIQNNKLCH
eukprot:TRINITY_DN32675_c0_g1_i1.p1 TRINITY_DN32675_c0_g1~~TRINITY_DN32675_c0_g1_i1.p1  ORF type:complete len:234 (+),score=10.52 TRINITY_DN32675_c0_g1_i1:95-703(+)